MSPKVVNFFRVSSTAKSLQSCLTLCDPINSSPPGSPVPGILQARTLEWVAISFSNACKWKVKVKLLSHVWPSATSWTAAFQAPPSMGFSRQEYWSGVPLPSPFIFKLNNVCSLSFYSLTKYVSVLLIFSRLNFGVIKFLFFVYLFDFNLNFYYIFILLALSLVLFFYFLKVWDLVID